MIEAGLKRIDETRRLNAVVVHNAERSRLEARKATGPLAGIPFSVKDNIAVQGWPLSLGVHVDPPPATFTATAVARLRAAGAILIAKTNLPPYGGGIETVNAVFGRTNNPYDLSRTVGGSSGGEAAAVAAGISVFGLGTDSGASVRLPAHFCGLAALKPTAGRVPVHGVIDDLGQIGPMSDPRTQIGILARTVADVARVLAVISDPPRPRAPAADAPAAPIADAPAAPIADAPAAPIADAPAAPIADAPAAPAEDAPAAPAADAPAAPAADAPAAPNGDSPRAAAPPASVRGLHVALFIADASDETVDTVRAAADALRDAGATVTEAAPPSGGHELTKEVWKSYGDEAISYDLLRRWDAYRDALADFGREYDLILSPVFPVPAPPHGVLASEPDRTHYTNPHNLTGWPAATVRAGTSADGLPIGVQLAARPWEDETALNAAAVIEASCGGFVPPPVRSRT